MALLCVNVLKKSRFCFLPADLSRWIQVCKQAGHSVNKAHTVSHHRTVSAVLAKDLGHLARSARTGPPLLPCSFVKTGSCVQPAPALKHRGHHFHTSAPSKALPASAVWLVLKPLQKLAAIILGR